MISVTENVIPATKLLLILLISLVPTSGAAGGPGQRSDPDRAIAARFAPVFFQALGENPRSDYITNFDFDGDWRGDNNWANAGDKKFPLRAFIYYAVSETKTHYFIHYAVFHPRDYKGGEQWGRLLSDLIRQGAKIAGDRDPTDMLADATVAHENDMEGVLVVAEKSGNDLEKARLRYVETLAHNRFYLYAVEPAAAGVGPIKAENDQAWLYIEPRGHGIYSYSGEPAQTEEKKLLTYRFAGKADDPETSGSESIGYDLVPISTTLWQKARASVKAGPTYGRVYDYSVISIDLVNRSGGVSPRRIRVGRIGSSFLGGQGGQNMARPPWGWFDLNRRADPLGGWFFNPAANIKRSFNLGGTFSTAYVRIPFWAGR